MRRRGRQVVGDGSQPSGGIVTVTDVHEGCAATGCYGKGIATQVILVGIGDDEAGQRTAGIRFLIVGAVVVQNNAGRTLSDALLPSQAVILPLR